ncbi:MULTISPECIES: GntR family transcriptional regulator [unclassified Paenibacillus]|uniref:GntR family transcriptional regulator n=1 Tax=unclassified Paenibacillus TaxID=185978 RepID=UPI00278152BE|nr:MULTISPECIES: GntR family transcriptional regulator [unclassified Paenibacillus]MDQ0897082.1 DNA-binding GntR family transcriptional regulator [Paenibacillus sp. V4I7]MDQ0916768.1 DNA-binding GntR family transcriptional regulator [Paenibacillus sp. V4I5]
MLQANELDMYTAIKDAIIEQKLRPNMQLVEEVLAESFGVSRTPVRNVLRRLASEKLVTVIPYKGTFVACPSTHEAKEVFEMRRVIEAAAIRKVCGTLTDDQFQQLKIMLDDEHEAHKQGDLLGALRITGDFHLRIAELASNYYYYHYLEELIALTYVIIAFYGMKKNRYCHDHEQILAAIKLGDADLAERLMVEHLSEIEASLDFEEHGVKPHSLTDIFKSRSYATVKR